MHLLVTRPGADAERTAERLRHSGHAVTLVPLLHIQPDSDAAFGPGPFGAVIMTSANAARALTHHPRRTELFGTPVFTVGGHTAQAAREAGFADVTSADGGWPELVRLVAEKRAGTAQPLLYLAAAERSGDIAGALAPHGLAVETVVIYRALKNPNLSQALRAALSDGVEGVLHYSRRSAQTFLTAARCAGRIDAVLRTNHYCLSSEVAAPLHAAGAGSVKIARRPDESALIELLSFG